LLVVIIEPKDKYSTVPLVRRPISQKLLLCGTLRIVPRPEVLLFTRKKSFIIETDRSRGHVQTDLWVRMYISHCDISWTLFSYSINFYSYEYYRKHRRGWSWLNKQMKETSKWNNSLISCTIQLQEHQQTITYKNFIQYSYLLLSA